MRTWRTLVEEFLRGLYARDVRNGAKHTSFAAAVESLEERQLLSAAVADVRSIDGTGNNLAHPEWGSAGSQLLRIAEADYGDGISTPAGADRPSAREISNELADQSGQDIISDRALSAMIYAWGQFIDHDLDLTPTGGTESFPVSVPTGDPSFDPAGTGTSVIPLSRSQFDPTTGTTTPREQINAITAWLDGSMIYGSDNVTATALRTLQGGRLKTSAGNLLPVDNAQTFPNGTISMANDAHRVANDELFAAGDVRANENIELTSLQTLFVREHNRLAAEIQKANPKLSDEAIYQKARAMVIAEIQAITYNEWLPTLLGKGAINKYTGYDPTVDPGIANEFSTAAFRLGHSLLGDDVEFLDNNGLPIAEEVALSDAFFNPDLVSANGIGPILKYLSSDPASEVDTKVVDSVRNFLFGPPGAGGLDLVSLNIQRGRDHGLADYNSIRAAYGLERVTDFSEITSNVELQGKLEELYGTVDNIDAWVGMLAEDHVAGSSVGVTLRAVISDQFERVRDGDRFWYQNTFSGAELKKLESTTLADVIRRNTGLTNLQSNVFVFQATVSGTVFADSNHDHQFGRNERAISSGTIELISQESGEVVASTQIGARGNYRFDVLSGLRTGIYTLRYTSTDGTQTLTSSAVAITRGGQSLTVNLGVESARSVPRHEVQVSHAKPSEVPSQPRSPMLKGIELANVTHLSPGLIDQAFSKRPEILLRR